MAALQRRVPDPGLKFVRATAMAHRLFSIPELCATIAESVPFGQDHLRDDIPSMQYAAYDAAAGYWIPMPGPASIASSTLAALACVSSIFKEPALGALWRRLKDMYPLARLLPREIVCLKNSIWGLVDNQADLKVRRLSYRQMPLKLKSSFVQVLASNIHLETRMIVLGYARRVRSIRRPIRGRVALNVVKLLITLGTPTFPFLDNLAIGPGSIEGLHLVKLLLCPSLVRIILDLDGFSTFDPSLVMAAEFVDTFPQICPNLESLRIFDEWGELGRSVTSVNRSLSRALPNLRLSNFRMSDTAIEPDTLITLHSATLIQTLHIHLGKGFAIPPAKDIFPALQDLSLIGPSQTCIDFVTSLHPTTIVRPPFKLRLFLLYEPPERLTHRIRDALGASLRELKILLSAAPPFESPVLLPLLECPNLQRVSIPIRMDNIEDDQANWDLLGSADRAWAEFCPD